uniref:Uncharacterized protein n=1 Tax=Avena sativa TaxID=4498 RepID=A0ACD5W6W8_AVESA
MAFFLVCTCSFVFILLFSYVLQLLNTDIRRRLPPGPRPLPVIGNILHVAGSLPHRSLALLAERYGPLMTLRLGTVVVIVVSSAATAREVLQTHNATLSGRNPPDAWHAMGHAADSVFVLPPRRKWRALRRIGTEQLLSPRRLDGDALRLLLRDAVLGMIHHVSELAAAGATVEVGRVAFAAMADLQWRAMFSARLDEATSSEMHVFAREAVALSLKPNVSDFFPALAAADLQGVRRGFTRHLARVYQLIDQQIEQRRCDRDARKGDLLDGLLNMEEQGKDDGDDGLVNQDFMRAFLTDIFLAAIDTISSTVEWAMAELLQHPRTMKKLQQELKSVLGSKTQVEYSDINQLPYLQAVVKETLRLHVVVPLVPNKAEAKVEIQGYTIPKGSTVLVNLWAIHHDPEIWTKPDKFIPERFLEDEEANFQGTDLRFIPFSAGRRICLGLPLATRMLHAMLGSLLRRFEWTLPREVKESGVDMSEELGLTMTMATPLQAIAKRF